MSDDLTPKQRAFCEEYLKDHNATQAALRAGYSDKSAHVHGTRLLKNDRVRSYLATLTEERCERTRIDADWLLRRLAEELEADIADILFDDCSLKPLQEWPKVWRQGLIAGLDVQTQPDGTVTTKIKLSDRVRRLEMIGKHVDVQAWRERVEHNHRHDLAETLERAMEEAQRKRAEMVKKLH